MDRSLTIGGNNSLGGSNPQANPASDKIESSAQSAHQAVDKYADKAATQVGRASGAVHQAVDSAAGAAASAAQWASSIPEQAKQATTKLSESACASIRARPLTTVAGAAVIGYLLGRLARF